MPAIKPNNLNQRLLLLTPPSVRHKLLIGVDAHAACITPAFSPFTSMQPSTEKHVDISLYQYCVSK